MQDLPVNAAIEYKFILVNNNMEAVEWQPGENRSIATSAGASSVQGRWDEPLQGESEDSSMDSLMSEGDVSDEGTAGGGSKESAPAAAKEGRKGKKQVSGRNAVGKVEPSAEVSKPGL